MFSRYDSTSLGGVFDDHDVVYFRHEKAIFAFYTQDKFIMFCEAKSLKIIDQIYKGKSHLSNIPYFI